MLCIIFTKKKLLAGIKTDQSHLFEIDGNTHINFEGRPSFEVLENNLSVIIDSYREYAKNQNVNVEDHIPTSLAFPVDFKNNDREKAIKIIENREELSFVLGENLVVSFVSGLKEQNKISGSNYLVLESLGDYTNLCYHIRNSNAESKGEVKEIGRDALFFDEEFEFYPFKNFGRSAGNENILNELLTEFSSSGLSVDVKGQTDLAFQLMNPNDDYRFTFSKTTDMVSIEAEIKLSEEKYLDLFTTNKDQLNGKLGEHAIQEKGIENVVLLGDFLKNKALQIYFEEELKLRGKLFSIGRDMDIDEYNMIIDGLACRTMEVLEAEKVKEEEIERKRKEEERRRKEEEKRMKIANELKVKEDRESLLQEIRENCVDPSKKEEYEEMYVARGERLQIPDVVIKWNITEVLSAIELKQEEESIGGGDDDDEEFSVDDNHVNEQPEEKEEQEEVVAVEESPSEPVVEEPQFEEKEEPVAEEKKEEEPVVVETKEEEPVAENIQEEELPQEESKEEPVVVTNSVNGQNGKYQPEVKPEPELVAVAVKNEPETKEQTQPVAKTETKVVTKEKEEPVVDESFPEPEVKKAQEKKEAKARREEENGTRNWKQEVKEAKMSLNDLFLIKGALKDPEFSTKKVTLYADHEPKVVKVLTAKEVNSPEKVARFIQLYEKELSYYNEMSELGVAKEGLYYFRDFIERTTLKDYVNKIGLDKKLSIEELTSSELKFILQVFKEVRELTVPHSNLSEDNILVVSKRKWNLQKNVEIKFIGFTADNTDEQGMIEETHKIFARLMGKEFYADFREKFQL
ncbi:MAG: hypothetical protein KDD99_21550 [Bacteroidetes bacterium]|nr:hypothetical protein [Bacteroidota bacterium]